MIENTYFMWEIFADEVLFKVIAWTKEQAFQKVEKLMPDAKGFKLAAVLEYWIPGTYNENLTGALRTFMCENKEDNK